MIFLSNDVWHNLITNRQFLWQIGLVFRRICKIVMLVKNWTASGRGRGRGICDVKSWQRWPWLSSATPSLHYCVDAWAQHASSNLEAPFLPLILNNKKVEKSISFSGFYFCRRNQINVNHLSYKFTGGTAILPRNSEFQEQIGIKLLTC